MWLEVELTQSDRSQVVKIGAENMKKYTIKSQYQDQWGQDCNDRTIVTDVEIGSLARTWGVSVDELMEQVNLHSDTLTIAEARAEARRMIGEAVTKAQAAKGCVRKALAMVGRDDAGNVVISATGRARLAAAADARIDANPDCQDVYDLAECYRSAQACIAMARKTGIIQL